MLQDEDAGFPRFPYISGTGIVTGDVGCYQAWRKPNPWTSRRVGHTFARLEDAIEALENEAKTEAGQV